MDSNLKEVTGLKALPARERTGHKGNYGRVLVVGGSRGMIGAVGLAANAALRGGAGLVTFAAPEIAQPYIAVTCPCATSIALACDGLGRLARESIRQLANAASVCDVLAIGPGMGVSPGAIDLVRIALEQDKPVVLDADGLNNLAKIDGWPESRRCPMVLTPHPGEFARLTGMKIPQIQASRKVVAAAAVDRWRAHQADQDLPLICALKGAGTVVTDGARAYINDTGNPGMATGGSGDVLTGLTAALIGQGMSVFDSACTAVWLHGRTGDLAAARLGQVAMIASDLLDYLPQAIMEMPTGDKHA